MQIEANPQHLINYYMGRAREHEHALAIHASVMQQLQDENAALKSRVAELEALAKVALLDGYEAPEDYEVEYENGD